MSACVDDYLKQRELDAEVSRVVFEDDPYWSEASERIDKWIVRGNEHRGWCRLPRFSSIDWPYLLRGLADRGLLVTIDYEKDSAVVTIYDRASDEPRSMQIGEDLGVTLARAGVLACGGELPE